MRYDVFPFILLLGIIVENESFFKSKMLQKVKDKAKNYYKSKFGTKGLNFLGYDLSEYPGSNPTHRKENQEKWVEYYQCLLTQNETLGKHKSFVPEAIVGFEGGYVKFDCKLCLSPDLRHAMEAVEWDFGKIDDNFLTALEFTEHIIVSPEDKSLSMYNLMMENSGQYVCRLGQTMTAPIFLTVVKPDNVSGVHPRTAPIGPYKKPPVAIMGDAALHLDTVWGHWSHCSHCNKVGKRYKYGYCILKHGVIKPPIINASTIVKRSEVNTETTNSTAEKIPEDNSSIILVNASDGLSTTPKSTPTKKRCFHCKQSELDLLVIFENGIPCQSHILPTIFKELPEVRERLGQIMVGYCKPNCPKAKVFEVRDKHGKVLEEANNSAGVYSMLQPVPPPMPPIIQKVQYAIKTKTTVISCPGNLNTDTPISWQIGGRNVISELLKEESHGRLYVSLSDKIYIKNSKISDSNFYSCWQDGEMAGMVRLVVEKKLVTGFNHHIMLFGIIIILSTFTFVYVKAFFGRKYAKV